MRPENAKLRDRAATIVARVTGADDAGARDALARAGWEIRTGCLVARGAEPARARALLAATRGNLRAALKRLGE
jgi:N-acetylmuramic acid 6-phosphate etherase